jgi:hypothetical protein
MRRLVILLALIAPGLANASAIDFDFEYLPDSAGCAVAVSSYGGSDPSCNFGWIVDNNHAGIQREMIDTEQGLTMEIDDRNNAIWYNGKYYCGNSTTCDPYLASFSKGLDEISVDFQGVGSGDSTFISDTFLYRISAWSGEFGTGELLGTAELLDIALPASHPNVYAFPLTLSLSGIGEFRSISIAALGINFDDQLTNLARVEAIHAVPEPGTLGLLGAALFGAAWLRRSRRAAR